MKEKFKKIKYRLVAAWWLLTRESFYLLAFTNKGKGTKTIETCNVELQGVVDFIRSRHPEVK
jgi:hypothetical protein